MLSREDRRWLEQSSGLPGQRHQRQTGLIAIGLAVFGTINLGLAFWIGHLEGYQPMQWIEFWTQEIQMRQQYSGAYVKGMERFVLAFLQLGVAVAFAAKAWLLGVERRRHQSVVQALQKSGAW